MMMMNDIALSHWVKFDFNDLSTRPTSYGKYLVCRKDGKIHWEQWNGSGWAYNHNVITHWAEIKSPLEEQDKKAKKEEKRRKGFSKWFAKAWEKSINSPDNHAEDWN
jgi:hypothetical protein